MRAWISSLFFYFMIFFICKIFQRILKWKSRSVTNIGIKNNIPLKEILLEVNANI